MADDNVLPFPRRLRAVPSPVAESSHGETAAVVHDGRTYPLAALLHQLTPDEQRIVDRSAPRSGQAAWDDVVRRLDEIAAAVGPAE